MNKLHEFLTDDVHQDVNPDPTYTVERSDTIPSWLIVVIFFVMTYILLHTIFFVGYVPTASMEPTIKSNDSIVFGVRHFKELKNNDVVVFKHDGQLLVKRIAYMSGDIIIQKGNEYKIPDGMYYMLGDNEEKSYDSRYWDEPLVPEEDIVAKIILPDCTIKEKEETSVVAVD